MLPAPAAERERCGRLPPHMRRLQGWLARFALLTAVGAAFASAAPGPPAAGKAAPTAAPALTRYERDRAKMMLRIVRDDLEKYYYDPTFRGLDVDRAFKSAAESIDEAETMTDLFTSIARPLFMLNDSHTNFFPPERGAAIHHGWEAQMFGDRCFITGVEPGSDAEAKGLKRGDEVLEIDGDRPIRETLHTVLWMQRVLAPRARSLLVIKHPGGAPETLRVNAKVVPRQMITDYRNTMDINALTRGAADQAYLQRHRMAEIEDKLLIWKMPGFDMDQDEVKTRILRQVRKYPNLILDMRGNGGGDEETLQTLVGGFIGPDTKIGDLVGRKSGQVVMARKAGDVYDGTIVALVDSFSGSAAEVLARALQIAGRAKVVGDRSAGAVMRSRYYDHMIGDRTGVTFGTTITIADLVMTDGRSLERVGVTPDEVVLPTAEDLVSGRDPALSRAAGLCGVTIPPEAAGALFPMEWHR